MVSSSVSSSVGTASPFCSLFFTVIVRSGERGVIGVVNQTIHHSIILNSMTN